MNNIIEKIRTISKSDSNKTFRFIATNIYNEFAKGVILSEKDLAKECFVSEATITNFCKKMGLSGYRELSIFIKYEIELVKRQMTIEIKNKNTDPNVKEIYNWIINKEDFFVDIADKIIEKKQLNLIVSYSVYETSKFLKDYLERIGINCKIISAQDYYKYEMINSSEVCLVILSGKDNETLIDILLKTILYKRNKSIYLISSIEEIAKINFEVKNTILLDYENNDKESSYIKNKFILISLFYMLITKIKKELDLF